MRMMVDGHIIATDSKTVMVLEKQFGGHYDHGRPQTLVAVLMHEFRILKVGERMKGNTAREIGKNRDATILKLVNDCKFVSRDQVQSLVFGHEYRQKCCERLMKLHKAKKISRRRIDNNHPYIYFPDGVAWNQKVDHYLILNWVYISLVQQIKSWFQMHVFKREYFCQWDDGHLLADALVVLKNTVKNKLHPVFIEVDREESNNKFDKVQRYGDYYKSKAWVNQWWAKPDPEGRYRFPKVLVVTDRVEKINTILERENEQKVRFGVTKLEHIKSDIYSFI